MAELNGRMYANQKKLPRLPVPSLASTVSKLERSLQPLVEQKMQLSSEERQKLTALLQDFAQSENVKRAQELLVKRAQGEGVDNWLDEWWLRLAYHSWREPLLVNSNWFMVFRDHPAQPPALLHPKLPALEDGQVTSFQIYRAAGFIVNGVNMALAIDNGELVPETMGRKKIPLCMNQYRLMFGWTRRAMPGCDENVSPSGWPLTRTAKNVMVLFRNQVFLVPYLDSSGKRLSLEQLQNQLWRIVQRVQNTAKDKLQPSVCLLTTEHRDTWAQARQHLLGLSPINTRSMDMIERSLFALCLDDWACPDDHSQVYANMAHSRSGQNRWCDKAISVITMSNGKAGMNGEHSPCDALIPSRLMDWLVENEPAREPTATGDLSSELDLPEPEWLEWHCDARMMDYIHKAHLHAAQIQRNSDPAVLIYDGYGADFIKTVARVSPDAYIQMVLQLAYYRTQGEFTATYETGSTRQFLLGRTECIRTLSTESCDFVKAMQDSAGSLSDTRKYE